MKVLLRAFLELIKNFRECENATFVDNDDVHCIMTTYVNSEHRFDVSTDYNAMQTMHWFIPALLNALKPDDARLLYSIVLSWLHGSARSYFARDYLTFILECCQRKQDMYVCATHEDDVDLINTINISMNTQSVREFRLEFMRTFTRINDSFGDDAHIDTKFETFKGAMIAAMSNQLPCGVFEFVFDVLTSVDGFEDMMFDPRHIEWNLTPAMIDEHKQTLYRALMYKYMPEYDEYALCSTMTNMQM